MQLDRRSKERYTMLAKERQNRILAIIRENNSIRMADIIKEFHVSHETARRLLDALQDQNLIMRVHGGAILAEEKATSTSMAGRTNQTDQSSAQSSGSSQSAALLSEPSQTTALQSSRTPSGMAERAAIGKSAASMIKEGETVFLSVGLTVQQIAKALRKRKNITVLTNSVLVLNELLNSDIQVYILGGMVNNSENNIEGPLALQTLMNFYVDIAFIGAGGITRELGISDYSLEVARLNEHIIRHARKSVLVAHSKKFGINCMSVTCPLDGVDTIISDTNLPVSEQEYLIKQGIETVLVNR